jgi:UDP-2,3-diacylglucosamine pyrophosphatase LpxH
MRKLLGFVYVGIVMLFSGTFASCEKSDPARASDPFANVTNERSNIVIISDMHLGADILYSECNQNLGILTELLQRIRVSKDVKELVIAGDLIDEWFVPATFDTYKGKGQSEFVKQVALTNKVVFDVLNQIIKDGKILVTYVPGNHDLAITNESVELVLPGINQARDEQQGLGTYTPSDFSTLAIEHGHRYNFACAPDPFSNSAIAPGSIMPPGYFFTRIAALSIYQGCKHAGDYITYVTPNFSGGESQALAFEYWQGWVSLMGMFPVENKFDEKLIVTNINGFAGNYSINDVMPYQTNPAGYIDMNLFKGIQDNWDRREIQNKVAVKFSAAQAIADQDDDSKTDAQAQIQYFMNPASDKRIVVFGHTHESRIITSQNYNGQKSIYVNSGTWIDSNPGFTMANFVVITPQNDGASSQTLVKLYNYQGGVITKMAVDSLRY